MACMLLAAKTEECSRKLSHVIREAWRLKNMAAKKGGGGAASTPELGDAVSDNVDKHGYLNEKSEEFVRLKERILLLERVVLHTIGFELSIDHPFKFILVEVRLILNITYTLHQCRFVDRYDKALSPNFYLRPYHSDHIF